MTQNYWVGAIILTGWILPNIPALPIQANNHQPVIIVQSPTVNRTIRVDDWEVTLVQTRTLGRKINYYGLSYEAEESWTAATVTMKNITSERLGENGIAFLDKAKLVDTQRNSYRAKHVVNDPRLSEKPFLAGESRTYTIMFDTPRQMRMSYIIIDGDSYLGF